MGAQATNHSLAHFTGVQTVPRDVRELPRCPWPSGGAGIQTHTLSMRTPALSPVRWPEREALADLGPKWSQGQLASAVGDMGGREQVSMHQSSS